jgi:NifB/MoaA-like Fe-S oxidoreductase
VLAAVERWQAEFVERLGTRFVYPSDEWFLVTGRPVPPRRYYAGLALEENGLGMVRAFLDDWAKVRKELRGRGTGPALAGRRATLVTATLFADTLRQTTGEFNRLAGTDLRVQAVLNERLGHSITVAGLLMGQDVLTQLTGQDLGELVVLPRVMFDHPQGISLDDVSPLQIAQGLRRPVVLADAMGDVLDALTGANPLRIDPDQSRIPLEVMRAGGWAVEKYL